jgi:NAD-dependent dihydropyrimidine dehydrogenase PreA subunit
MPLNANLQRIDTVLFVLTVPPVNFFNLQVSPSAYCNVTQNNTAVIIESDTCILDGSPYVKSLNGCFKFRLKTVFTWEDTPDHKIISSTSNLVVEVDPPPPFSRIARPILRNTGYIAMNTAISYIEKEFVKSLTKDFAHWANDDPYRSTRALCSAVPGHIEIVA